MSSVFGIDLPQKWSASSLKYLASFLGRGTAPVYADDGEIFAVSQAVNQVEGLDWTRARFHAFSGNTKRLKGLLQSGDSLINSTGTGTLGRVGYYAAAPESRTAMADSHVTVFRADPDELDPRFAYYWLSSAPFQQYVYAALAVGATNQIELNREQLGNAPIPVPSLDEQRRIANFLDAETTRLDHLTQARNDQLDALTERSFAAVSESLIPGTLTRPLRKYPYPWLPAMPANTRLTRLGYVCRLQNGVTVDEGRARTDSDVTRPYLRVANVQAGHVALDSVTEITVPKYVAKRSTLRAGDVLMTEGGDLDKLGRGTVWRGELANCLHQNHVFALRPELDKLDPEYLALMTQTVHGRCYFESTGTKTTNLASTNSGKILSFPIPLPDLQRQQELVRQVQKQQETVREARQILTRQSALLAERRQALITAAVTGRLDVTTARGVEAP
ncbi:hypothetical protein GCM10010252_01320 [Streptomyces aureoverticillatus]|nr:hypothetical protein GCM10010252_01320 [Streptomyces aureoverticillatus]